MSIPEFAVRIEALFRSFNEPVIAVAAIEDWLGRFAAEDRPAALLLLERVIYHTYPRLVREARALHARLAARLAAEGFDAAGLKDVDFSREFTCKSGDIISYIYRKANLVPTVDFKNFDRLIAQADRDPAAQRERALVILDDYIGTGSQFIFQFVARSAEDMRVIANYRRVFLACIVVHPKAIEKGLLLRAGRFEDVIRLEELQIPDVDFRPEEQSFAAALRQVDWRRIELIAVEQDRSLLADDDEPEAAGSREVLARLLEKYELEGSQGGTQCLLGRHAFFYGAPNSLPAILLPLFKRVEDFTIYPSDNFTGITSPIINYDGASAGGLKIRPRPDGAPPGAGAPSA